MQSVLTRFDRVAGGRDADYTVPVEGRDHPRTRRVFSVIAWLLAAELVVGSAAVVVALVLTLDGAPVPFAVWMRSVVVLGMTVFSLILIGVADYLDSDHMREAFPRPARAVTIGP